MWIRLFRVKSDSVIWNHLEMPQNHNRQWSGYLNTSECLREECKHTEGRKENKCTIGFKLDCRTLAWNDQVAGFETIELESIEWSIWGCPRLWFVFNTLWLYFELLRLQYNSLHILSSLITVEYDTIWLRIQYDLVVIFNHNNNILKCHQNAQIWYHSGSVYAIFGHVFNY